MQSSKLGKLVQAALLTAVTILLGSFFRLALPSGTGYVTLLDTGVYVAAFLLGRSWGGLVGGLAGFCLDLFSGYPQWAFFSLVAHGGQGYGATVRWWSGLWTSLFMVTVYALGATFLYGPAAALPDLLPNFIQTTLGFVLAQIIRKLIRRDHA